MGLNLFPRKQLCRILNVKITRYVASNDDPYSYRKSILLQNVQSLIELK